MSAIANSNTGEPIRSMSRIVAKMQAKSSASALVAASAAFSGSTMRRYSRISIILLRFHTNIGSNEFMNIPGVTI